MQSPTRMLGFSLSSKSSQRMSQPIVAYAQVMYRPSLTSPPPPPMSSALFLSSPPPTSTLFIPPPLPPPPPAPVPVTLLLQPLAPAISPRPPPEPEREPAVREFCTSPTEIRIEHEEIEEIPTENTCRGRIWQIALGINLLLLLGAAIAIPFIILSAWPSTSSTSSINLPSQCTSYTVNIDDTRYYTYTATTTGCDKPTPFGSTSSWVRFAGSQATMLATNVIPSNQCGTSGTGYYTGSLPTVGTTVQGTVCFNSAGNPCLDSNTISVTNCSGFYIYLLTETPNCNERYCTM